MAHTESELELERQRLLEQLLAEEGIEASATTIPPRNHSEPIPVTFAQEVLWLLDRSTPGLTAYNTPLARRVRGPLDVPAFTAAIEQLVARHEALRTVFVAHDEGAAQVVLPPAAVAIELLDVQHIAGAEREQAAISALRNVADSTFDITKDAGFRVAVARLADNDHIILLLTHHIVSDAWSYGVMLRDLGVLYDAARSNTPAPLAPPALQLGDYATWQRATENAASIETGLQYWRARLAGVPTLELPTDFPRPVAQGFGGARHGVLLPTSLQTAIRALAQANGATVYMVLLAAYATVMQRYSPQDEVVVGSAVAGRTKREMENIVGYFSQALPMRVRFADAPTFAELLHNVRDTVLGAFEHQDTPLESLVLELQRNRVGSHAPLFRVVLTMQDLQGGELRLGDAELSAVELDQTSTKFDLTLLATERADGLELSLWYRTDLFTAGYAERFVGHLQQVLEAVAQNPRQTVASIALLSDAERGQLAAWNATTLNEGPAATFVSLFEAQANRVAERTAVVAGDTSYTYAKLNALANQLAHELRGHGVGGDTPVGLLVDRSAEAIVALTGILKAGGCYVPLSDDAPPARIAQQLNECGARVVVTTTALAANLPATVQVIELDDEATRNRLALLPAGDVASTVTPSSLGYVLYTSGSTGVPKGVAITHANMVHYARAISRVLADVSPAQAGDGFAALDGWHFGLASTFAADLGNTSVLPSLLAGGTLHVLAKDVTTDGAQFAEYLRTHALDVIKMTPNHLMALTAGKRGRELGAILPRRWTVVGGEALRIDTARELLAAETCRVLNHYGPTETTVGVCTFEATRASLDVLRGLGALTVPVGYPLANTRAYVVDLNNSELPVGIPGELLIGGDGVAAGYLNRPDLTAERFVQVANDRVYRTGDKVRRLENGAIEFIGRADDQVKVRGFRVELGEIAGALRSHPGVELAEVVLNKTADDVAVIGYVVAKQAGYAVSHTDRPTSERLRDWVASQLPEYMVPAAVVLLDQMPLTPNGKVDRQALPLPDSSSSDTTEFVAPRDEVEVQLCQIWQDVLKKEQVGVTDNFLALGGHSLLAIRVLGKISKAFGVRLPLRTLFEAPTVEALAVAVAAAKGDR